MSTQDRSAPSRPWLIALPTAALVALGAIWSGFWYYASDRAEATMTAWRTREADAGRVYGCANARFGGYPFRIEVDCAEPSVDDRATSLSVRCVQPLSCCQDGLASDLVEQPEPDHRPIERVQHTLRIRHQPGVPFATHERRHSGEMIRLECVPHAEQ